MNELTNYYYKLLNDPLAKEINAIFGVPSSSLTTNNNTWTWMLPPSAGSATNNVPSPAPVAVTQILYRRNTHDENGNYKLFTKEQEQLWRDLASIATMTSSYIWKTAEEIFLDATDYQKRTGMGNIYISLDSVKTSLATLVVNRMVEEKNG